ncbi:hypothetical protein FJV41_44120 [Myxococcus llanfairpwllgwyngyllgogerychwyrndrobwllllantysiliogogogochensis]|uniref:Uncharacterized protein n=1 Tax=Myxococcus llanfairpwllgwyngyllgogerychwyrndrobwllllantysiliogogogochensis TaxID=2590453 RepID=A0A540WKI8_9BACT|nr:hypothetical protein [Myxococcus llanfairpwllgwyngyllgogerychwyrndrobwllllantysiliogogogochensis]TQF09533.1 hypothetical protein FJV41_44120 [Myxococcus llanfairpwllgwyngyllgogerychwyrndrobwllllantysiliogogogochensis]
MPLLNPSFEDTGARPGEAAHWTLTTVTRLEVLAGFGAPEEACEDFERWYVWRAALSDVSVALAFFGQRDGFEDFSRGWGNDGFLFELPPAQLVPHRFEGNVVETWGQEPFLADWADVTSVSGLFSDSPREDFEQRWHTNETYAWRWEDVTARGALFNTTQPTEDFGTGWPLAATQ